MKYRLAVLLALLVFFALSVTAHAARIPSEPDGITIQTVKKVR